MHCPGNKAYINYPTLILLAWMKFENEILSRFLNKGAGVGLAGLGRAGLTGT